MNVEALIERQLGRYYRLLSTPMTFRSPVNSKAVSVNAIDRTSATILNEKSLEISVTKPAATVQRSSLAAWNISPEQMVDVNVAFVGKNWRVLSIHDKPAPSSRMPKEQLRPVWNWGNLGEVILILMEV